ncbi:MAG: hypothetical protein ACXADH_00235 [Candidatus Kariarchaeaceae archaeon]|jgi:hypothetical protein
MSNEKANLADFNIPEHINLDLLSSIYNLTFRFGTSVYQNDQITKGVKRLHGKLRNHAITAIIAASRDDSINHSLAILFNDQFSGDGHSHQYQDANGIHKLYIDSQINNQMLEQFHDLIHEIAKSKGAEHQTEMDLETYQPNLKVDQYFTVSGACIPVVQQDNETPEQIQARAQQTIESFDQPEQLLIYDFGEYSPIGNGLGIIKKDDLDFVNARQKAAKEAMDELGVKFSELADVEPAVLVQLKTMVEEKLANV